MCITNGAIVAGEFGRFYGEGEGVALRSARPLVERLDSLRDQPPSLVVVLVRSLRRLLASTEASPLLSVARAMGAPSPDLPKNMPLRSGGADLLGRRA